MTDLPSLRARAEALLKEYSDTEVLDVPAWADDASKAIRSLLAALPSSPPVGVIAWAHYRDGKLFNVFATQPDIANPRDAHDPGPRSQFVPLVAASPPAMTVGAALADPRVQDGSHVVEYKNGDAWRQLTHRGVREWCAGQWHLTDDRIWIDAYARSARLVAISDADQPPESRGAL